MYNPTEIRPKLGLYRHWGAGGATDAPPDGLGMNHTEVRNSCWMQKTSPRTIENSRGDLRILRGGGGGSGQEFFNPAWMV